MYSNSSLFLIICKGEKECIKRVTVEGVCVGELRSVFVREEG
jgi:hypothetical protein